MTERIRCLSLWQPWASLIALGAKRIETRSWQTPYRGWLAIHATAKWDRESLELCFQQPFSTVLHAAGIATPDELPLGAIVAVARLDQCVSIQYAMTAAVRRGPVRRYERAFGDYSHGRYGWILTDVRALTEPIRCKGTQGVWTPPADVLARVREQLGEAVPA